MTSVTSVTFCGDCLHAVEKDVDHIYVDKSYNFHAYENIMRKVVRGDTGIPHYKPNKIRKGSTSTGTSGDISLSGIEQAFNQIVDIIIQYMPIIATIAVPFVVVYFVLLSWDDIVDKIKSLFS